jgi:hypothetical protein
VIAIDSSAAGFTTSGTGVALTPLALNPIIVVPVPSPVANPAAPCVSLIVATPATVELHCPVCVKFCVVPSVYVPVAVYCCVIPSGIVAVGGLIAIDSSAAAVTVSNVDPLIVPDVAVAVIFAVPTPTLLATPCIAAALLIVAVVGVSELHVTVVVRFCVLPSVKVPVAVNPSVVPSGIVGIAGVTAIETNAAALTVSTVDPLIVPDVAVAVIFAVPVPTLLATPCVPAALLIVATVGVSELHVTVLVMFCVLPSVNIPVAVNVCVVPSGIVGIAGVTAIETSTAGVTVSVVEPLIVPMVALTVVLPTATVAATPCEFTVATLLLAVLQVIVFVRFKVLPSL